MRKLGALDANFFYTETASTPNHISSLQIFELPPGCDESTFVEGLKTFLDERKHLVQYLTHKVRFVPANFDHPVWVPDPSFNVANHVTRIDLPFPADFARLEAAVADIHAELMDRDRPLWHIYVITGLEGGRIAYYNQAHHAAMDGMAGQAATEVMMDTTPNHPAPPATHEKVTRSESMTEMLRLSFENLVNFYIDAPNRTLGTVDSMSRLLRRSLDPRRATAGLSKLPPRTRFNRSIGKRRTYAAGQMPISEMKAMAKASGSKLNDVFLAACAGGLRAYLSRRGELPRQSMVAGCPVSLRKSVGDDLGNQVTMMSVSLATDIADPVLRLRSILDSSLEAKSITQDLMPAYNPEVSLPGLPTVITSAMRMVDRFRLAEVMQPMINLVISNVPGPKETLYSNGARMLTHYPVSIPTHGLGLNITVSSYVDQMYFSVNGCARALPDAQQLRDDIAAAYAELRDLLLPMASVSPLKRVPENKVTEVKPQEALELMDEQMPSFAAS